MDSVDSVHEELNFQHYAPFLKAITGVWSSIQKGQQAARRDPTKLKPYRIMLERAISKAKLADVVDGDDAEALGRQLQEYAESLYSQHQLAQRAVGRSPSDIQAWMRKWHPKVSSDYESRLDAFFDGPSTESLQQAKAAVYTFVEVFCGSKLGT
jgi:hypothetical protein